MSVRPPSSCVAGTNLRGITVDDGQKRYHFRGIAGALGLGVACGNIHRAPGSCGHDDRSSEIWKDWCASLYKGEGKLMPLSLPRSARLIFHWYSRQMRCAQTVAAAASRSTQRRAHALQRRQHSNAACTTEHSAHQFHGIFTAPLRSYSNMCPKPTTIPWNLLIIPHHTKNSPKVSLDVWTHLPVSRDTSMDMSRVTHVTSRRASRSLARARM